MEDDDLIHTWYRGVEQRPPQSVVHASLANHPIQTTKSRRPDAQPLRGCVAKHGSCASISCHGRETLARRPQSQSSGEGAAIVLRLADLLTRTLAAERPHWLARLLGPDPADWLTWPAQPAGFPGDHP